MERFKRWVEENITEKGDDQKDFVSNGKTESPEENPLGFEVPDVPDSPTPGSTLGQLAKDQLTGCASGLALGVIIETLKNIILSDQQKNRKKS